MALKLNDDQTALGDALGNLLARSYAWDARQRIVASDAGWSSDLWDELAGFGALGLTLPQALGGLGLGATEHLVVLELFGEALVVEPYVSTAVIAPELLAASDTAAARALGEAVVAGDARVAWAQGEQGARYVAGDVSTMATRRGAEWRIDGAKAVVIDAPVATHLLITARTAGDRRDPAGVSLFLIEADRPGIERQEYRTIDGRRAADLRFRDLSLPATALLLDGDPVLPAVDRANDAAAAAACAEMVGAMRGAVRGTLAHTSERRQFGAPLAQLQVIQHRLADMFMALELAHAHALEAARAMRDPAPTRARAISAAKAGIGRSARNVCEDAVQLHGGMGMTDELPIGHYLKLAVSLDARAGSSGYHLGRFASARHAAA